MLSYFYGPRWSPDGRSFLIQGYDLKGQRGVYQIDAATGQVTRRAVEIPTNLPPGQRWSPDGKSFFFRRAVPDTGEMEFVQRDLATGTEKQLLRRPHVGGNLSPASRYLATESVDPATNSRTMLLVALDGREPREVMRVPSDVAPDQLKVMDKGRSLWVFVWSPDSRWFLMRKRFADLKVEDEVWLVPVDGASPKKLETRLSRNNSALWVHPEGRQVAFNVNNPDRKRRSELWALENFLPAVDGKK